MRSTSIIAAFLAAGLSVASPIEKRVTAPTVNDGIILNYALTLEYLERKFYQEALANYTQADFVAAGFPDPFYTNLMEIYFDEQTHVSFLSGALAAAGITPTVELQYSFPATDVKSFVTLSSVLEGVGVSAYLGAAASIMNPDYLTAAGSILTVEARHTSYIRASLGESPFPNPFDTPLDFNEVYSLASAFIVGGSSPVTLPFMAFPALTLQCTQYYYETNRSSVTFSGAFTAAKGFASNITSSTPIYAVFFSGLMKLPVQVCVTGQDYKISTLPAGISGQVYVVLSTSNTDFSDDNIIAGPAILEVYPKGMIPSTPHPECS
ncbi:MAG: hypothetical protein FRX48_01693 [Lasallia pustulata]|uniref:Uncharacterized protein n=1 Tax=Lasallia pustulata TaxID=136370 RepID=A0A5M8Q0S7_9LECA|nr:MAG: hypothetical protein FRX48_01693 [Lasallia pustulata]